MQPLPVVLYLVLSAAHVTQRRTFLAATLAVSNAPSLLAALCGARWDDAAEVLEQATAAKQVDAAARRNLIRANSRRSVSPRQLVVDYTLSPSPG